MLAEDGGTLADRNKPEKGRRLPLLDFPTWRLVLHPEGE